MLFPAFVRPSGDCVGVITYTKGIITLSIEGRAAGTVFLEIPAAQLPRGPYVLKLFTTNVEGTEQRVSGSYFFTVE